jgi:GTP-binding protein Era
MVTDRAERFLAAEMIREQVLLQTHQEVPYGTAIRIEEFIDDPVRDRLLISATVLVERDSQKGIVIGRQGSRLRAVGTAARHALIRFFGRPVHLELQVRLQQDWTSRERTLRELGYDKDDI